MAEAVVAALSGPSGLGSPAGKAEVQAAQHAFGSVMAYCPGAAFPFVHSQLESLLDRCAPEQSHLLMRAMPMSMIVGCELYRVYE